MTILTKQARLAVIESVIKATYIPAEREEIRWSTSAAIRAALVPCLPDGYLKATENLPREWFTHITLVSVYSKDCPDAVLEGRDQCGGTRYVDIEPLRHPRSNLSHSRQWGQVLASQIEAATKLRAKEEALRTELANFLASCKTYAKVVEGMPDLERHLPAVPAKQYPIVASTAELSSVLGKLGFDQGVKK